MDQLDLVKTVNSLCQRVVVAVATATYRTLDTDLGQPFAIADSDVLRSPVGVMGQRTVIAGLTVI